MLALRVPCDARMSQRDVNSLRSDSTSRNPRLILCFSASLNGRLEIKSKDEGPKRYQSTIVIPACLKPESILFTISEYLHSPV